MGEKDIKKGEGGGDLTRMMEPGSILNYCVKSTFSFPLNFFVSFHDLTKSQCILQFYFCT